MKDKKYLDDVNNKRVEETRTRVAHAIKLCDNPVGCLTEGRIVDNAVTDIAHAVNLLEAAEQDMRFACEHFGWDTGICDQLNAAMRPAECSLHGARPCTCVPCLERRRGLRPTVCSWQR